MRLIRRALRRSLVGRDDRHCAGRIDGGAEDDERRSR